MEKDMGYDVSCDGKREKSFGFCIKRLVFKINFCAAICRETFFEKITILSLLCPNKIVSSFHLFIKSTKE